MVNCKHACLAKGMIPVEKCRVQELVCRVMDWMFMYFMLIKYSIPNMFISTL